MRSPGDALCTLPCRPQVAEAGIREIEGHQDTLVLGARFAKWRAVIAIDDHRPSRGCIEANAHALARYAALCQEAGLVPVVEPDELDAVLVVGAEPFSVGLATPGAMKEILPLGPAVGWVQRSFHAP